MLKTYTGVEIVWDTKAPLDSHGLETSAASMDGVLGDQICQREENKAHVPKDEKADEGTYRKDWVHLVLDESYHFYHALLASHFARASRIK